MLNKVSTVSILLLIVIALIVFFGVRNGKNCSGCIAASTKTNASETADSSAFKGKR